MTTSEARERLEAAVADGTRAGLTMTEIQEAIAHGSWLAGNLENQTLAKAIADRGGDVTTCERCEELEEEVETAEAVEEQAKERADAAEKALADYKEKVKGVVEAVEALA